jgi:integrase
MAVYKRGNIWWYKFNWKGEPIRETTKQSNKRVAEQMEAAHKTSLAKCEVGIRDRAAVPTLKEFAEKDFKPYIESRFTNRPKTLEYYRTGLKNLSGYAPLAGCILDTITAERISGFVAKRREAGLEVSSINRQLEVLRRMLKLAVEWGKVEKAPSKVEMLPGEKHRDRVLSADEEAGYLDAATAIGENILESYRSALEGIRATKRGEEPIRPEDPFLLRDVTTVLMDCGVRPEECFRLRWEHVRDGAVHVPFGKTENARRTIPLTPRAAALLEMRRAVAKGEWVFPAPTRSGHIEKSSLKKQHPKASKLANVPDFPLYTFRHTCLTRWAAFMDPYTLGYLAGHSDFATTRRYVHPQAHTVMEAIERARNAQRGHKPLQKTEAPAASLPTAAIQ